MSLILERLQEAADRPMLVEFRIIGGPPGVAQASLIGADEKGFMVQGFGPPGTETFIPWSGVAFVTLLD